MYNSRSVSNASIRKLCQTLFKACLPWLSETNSCATQFIVPICDQAWPVSRSGKIYGIYIYINCAETYTLKEEEEEEEEEVIH